MANFNRGGAAAREASKKSFKKTKFLRLTDGESEVVRLIDPHEGPDCWIYINQHSFVPTKGAPDWAKKESKDKWPQSMGAVCRYSKSMGTGEFVFPELAEGGCYICDHMTNPKTNKKYSPSVKLWARAVLRDEIVGTQAMADSGQIPESRVGKALGYRDRQIEVEQTDSKGETTGKVTREPAIVILNFGMKNFFTYFQTLGENYGTVLDRDYRITRIGEGLDTDYGVSPREPIETVERGDDGKPIYDKDGMPIVTRFTLDDSEIRAKYTAIISLEDVITEQASDDHFATFFDPTKEIPRRGKDSEDEDEPATTPKVSEDETRVDPARLEALRDRTMAMAATTE